MLANNHRDNNIFYGVLNNEDRHTELFCNLLMYKPFRQEVMELLKQKLMSMGNDTLEKLSLIDYEDIDTQDSSGTGRPDIVISNANVHINIECKITPYCALTDNQPTGYLEKLHKVYENEKKLVALFFLVPKGYSCAGTIRERWEQWLTDSNMPEASPLRTLKTEERYMIYWEDIARIIEEMGLHTQNPIFEYFLMHIKQLLDHVTFTDVDIEVYNDFVCDASDSKTLDEKEAIAMANNTLPLLINKLFAVVDTVFNNLKGDRYVLGSMQRDRCEYGFDIYDLSGKPIIYFGIWYSCWNEFNAPFCILATEENYEKFRKLDQDPLFKQKPFKGDANYLSYVYPLSEDILKSEYPVAKLIERVEEVLKLYFKGLDENQSTTAS